MTYTSDFYSPMLTSQQNCRMRFFYFINGEPASIYKTVLRIYIRYASKLQPESLPITQISLNVQGDLQQMWNKAVTQFQSTQPFQFVFRGTLGTNLSRIAIDDISFDQNCASSSILPLTTTTPSPTSSVGGNTGKTGATDGPPVTFTNLPTINRQKDKGSSGGKVAAGVLIPLFLVFAAIGAYFGYRKYQQHQRTDENISLSMKGIVEDQDD